MYLFKETENLEYYSKCYFLVKENDINRIEKWCADNKIKVDNHFLFCLDCDFFRNDSVWVGINEKELFFPSGFLFSVQFAAYKGASVYFSFDDFLISEHVKRIIRIHDRKHLDEFKLPFIVSPQHMRNFSNKLYKEYRSNNPAFDDFLKMILHIIDVENNPKLSILLDFLQCDNVETNQITSGDSYLKYFINLYNKGLTPSEVVNHLNTIANVF